MFFQKNQQDIDRINAIINERIGSIQRIVNVMEANRWLSNEEQSTISQDQILAIEQNQIAERLNRGGNN